MARAYSVSDIIARALRLLGVIQSGETPSADESKDCFDVLNMMLGDWNNERLMMIGSRNETFSIAATQEYYTIGEDGYLDTDRPGKITKAFARYTTGSDTVDYEIDIITNNRWQELFSKTIENNIPQYLYYNPLYPLGRIYLWARPAEAFTLGLTMWSRITTFESISQDIELPDGYPTALAYNLAVEMAPEFGKKADQIIVNKAIETKQNIKRVNTEPIYMDTDPALMPTTGSFNVHTGSWL